MGRASAKLKFFTLAEFLIPSDKKMCDQILKMANFSKQILFEVAAAAAFSLLNKKTLNKKFKVGDLVYIPGRLLKKHPNSLRDALGKIKEITNTGRDYIVEMIDGGTLKRHFSDLVSATATKNQSDVTLIDPFQLIDFKTRILPEHLYPKFRLQLDKFKSQNPSVDITEVPDDSSQDQEDDDHLSDLTGDQRVDKAIANNNPSGADVLLRKIIENVNSEDVDFPADLRNISKPKSFNKRKDKKEEKKSTPEYKEPVQIQPPEESRTNPEVEDQQVYKEPIQIQPEILENNEESRSADSDKSKGDNSEEIQGNLRRSTRVPKMSVKLLHMLTVHPDTQESSIFSDSNS